MLGVSGSNRPLVIGATGERGTIGSRSDGVARGLDRRWRHIVLGATIRL
jgi:hypothetical protein